VFRGFLADRCADHAGGVIFYAAATLISDGIYLSGKLTANLSA
jgi:hypothetical protein